MAGAAAQTKSTQLAERINALAAERTLSGNVNEWTWNCLKRDVDAYGKSPEFEAESLIFMTALWSIRSDIIGIERCLNIYAGKYGKDWAWHRVRAMQGPAFGRVDMVVDMLKFGVPQGSSKELFTAANLCNQSGLFVTSYDLFERARSLSGDAMPAVGNESYAHLPRTVNYMREHGLDELEVSSRLAVASEVVREMTGPLRRFRVNSSDWGITFEFSVDATIERLVEIDFAITRKLVADFEDDLSRHLSIGVTPFFEDVTHGS